MQVIANSIIDIVKQQQYKPYCYSCTLVSYKAIQHQLEHIHLQPRFCSCYSCIGTDMLACLVSIRRLCHLVHHACGHIYRDSIQLRNSVHHVCVQPFNQDMGSLGETEFSLVIAQRAQHIAAHDPRLDLANQPSPLLLCRLAGGCSGPWTRSWAMCWLA